MKHLSEARKGSPTVLTVGNMCATLNPMRVALSSALLGLVPGIMLVVLATAGCFEKLSGPGCVAATWDVAGTSADTITTTRGLRYIAGDSGVGNGAPWCRSVAVNYTGYLLDGTKFDSSIDVGRALIFTPGVGSVRNEIEAPADPKRDAP